MIKYTKYAKRALLTAASATLLIFSINAYCGTSCIISDDLMTCTDDDGDTETCYKDGDYVACY